MDARHDVRAGADHHALTKDDRLRSGVVVIDQIDAAVIRGDDADAEETALADPRTPGQMRRVLKPHIVGNLTFVIDRDIAPDHDPVPQRAAFPHAGVIADQTIASNLCPAVKNGMRSNDCAVADLKPLVLCGLPSERHTLVWHPPDNRKGMHDDPAPKPYPLRHMGKRADLKIGVVARHNTLLPQSV